MCVHAKSFQLCPTLSDPLDCRLPDSPVHGVLLARILGWVAMPSSRGSSWPRDQPKSPATPALAGGFFITSATWEATDLDERKNSHSFLSSLLGLLSHPRLP